MRTIRMMRFVVFIEYYSNKNNGEYEPYCKAIVDCLEEML